MNNITYVINDDIDYTTDEVWYNINQHLNGEFYTVIARCRTENEAEVAVSLLKQMDNAAETLKSLCIDYEFSYYHEETEIFEDDE